MEQLRAPFQKRNSSTLYYTLSIILGTVAFSYGSVPMYKMICQTTGWGGQPIKAPGHGGLRGEDPSARLQPVTSAKRIRITFNGSVSDVLPWKFVPQQREVRVLPGETALAFYTATNKSDEDIIGVATYSVTPGQVAQYFSKIQCFCFEEQRLNAGETVDMPVFFYIDPEFVNDPMSSSERVDRSIDTNGGQRRAWIRSMTSSSQTRKSSCLAIADIEFSQIAITIKVLEMDGFTDLPPSLMSEPLSMRRLLIESMARSASTTTRNSVLASPFDYAGLSPSRSRKTEQRILRPPIPKDAWKKFSRRLPFLAVPPEIHLKIFELLHPVDAVCLSIVNIAPTLDFPLGIGAPDSCEPLPRRSGCRHCLPVLFYPAHCELHFHLSSTAPSGSLGSIIPPHLRFCSCCQYFTACEDGNLSDRAEYCGALVGTGVE
ncbi:Cytochrome c oxidase assembly [Hyphodiscus hymeniophilus]|uniref:Cytochrome c oxidase assembly n=1 Tax=Hyphodiscus hymeniophilus TaxID=353542 RepID=A0A9P6SL58_9HELO|nr:Cytochrome c oxidase assembly [Hyphodiscus hymeniophilus]